MLETKSQSLFLGISTEVISILKKQTKKIQLPRTLEIHIKRFYSYYPEYDVYSNSRNTQF